MFARHYFYNNLADTKPVIAISACLMGDAVRYDGQHKAFPVIARYFQQHAQLEKVCPEEQAHYSRPGLMDLSLAAISAFNIPS